MLSRNRHVKTMNRPNAKVTLAMVWMQFLRPTEGYRDCGDERNAPYDDDLVVDGHVDIVVESVEPIDDEIDAQTERGEHPESSARDGERVNEVAEGALGR